MAVRPALDALAARAGILPSYVDVSGIERRATDATREALLAAMGFDASDEQHAAAGLDALEAEERGRVLDPVRVVRYGDPGAGLVMVRAPDGAGVVDWHMELAVEDGGRQRLEGRTAVPRGGEPFSLSIPSAPPGYHTLRCAVGGRAASQALTVVPRRCVAPEELLGSERAYGILANLYSIRSADDWGVGDLGHLRRLSAWAASRGAAFLGINPLHALRNRALEWSPYRPVSRLYRNEIYLDVTAVPELAESAAAQSLLASDALRAEVTDLRAAARIDYERVARLKRRLLQALHQTFWRRSRHQPTPRSEAYRRFLAREGKTLDRFATFMALDEHWSAARAPGDPRHDWPAEYRDAESPAVVQFAGAHAEEIDFHRYVQFELERQLVTARGDLPLGIYQDLAVGTAPYGADVWMWPSVFAHGVSIGAPPDPYAWQGQNWGVPPLDPHRLRADGYRFWIRLLRAGLAQSGALRIDHVMGLLRLFWIPDGRSAADGAYVRYPAQDLLGLLALESRRHLAVIIGEDLGTVPPEVRPTLADWGVSGCDVVYFARDSAGDFLPSDTYRRQALVTVGTHDHIPFRGFWAGADVSLRRSVGAIKDDDAADREREIRSAERAALVARLRAENCLAAARAPESYEDVLIGMHRFLVRTPSALVGVALDDLAGETEPANLPGIGPDVYPSWRRRMGKTVEELARDHLVEASLEPLSRLRVGRRPSDAPRTVADG